MNWNSFKYVLAGLVLTTMLALMDSEVNSLHDLARLENVPAMILYTLVFSLALRTVVVLARPRQ